MVLLDCLGGAVACKPEDSVMISPGHQQRVAQEKQEGFVQETRLDTKRGCCGCNVPRRYGRAGLREPRVEVDR
jgi:hypothetical protein